MANLADGIWSRWLVRVFIAAWVISLFLPVAYSSLRVTGPLPGYYILLVGYLGVVTSQFGWFANIGFLFCILKLLVGDNVSGFVSVVAVITLLLVVNALFWRVIQTDHGKYHIHHFGSGYFLWLFAVGGAAIQVLARYWQRRHLGN